MYISFSGRPRPEPTPTRYLYEPGTKVLFVKAISTPAYIVKVQPLAL